MSTQAKTLPITIDQYLRFECPAGYRDELIYGEIVVSPEAKPPLHHDIALNLFSLLSAAAGPEYRTGMRMNFRMPKSNSMPSPDIWLYPMADWRAARDSNTYPTGRPILAVEVISPSNRKRRVDQKVGLYLDGGAAEVRRVYPRRQQVVVHGTASATAFQRLSDRKLRLPAPLRGEISISDIFRSQ